MIHLQAVKKVALEPASFTNGATASVVIDTLNFDYAIIDFQLGRANATSSIPAIIVQESDTNVASNFATITALNTTALNPTAVLTNGVTIVTANIDLKPRKRFLQAQVTPVTTQVVGIQANLGRPGAFPTTAAQKNVNVDVNA